MFVFDYDKEGFNGCKQLKDSLVANNDNMTKAIYYQENYDSELSEKPNDSTSYMAEDLFDPASYASKVNPVHMMNTHKQFRNNKQATSDAIKEYIKNAYPNFEKEWLQNFKPVLNKL